MTRRPPAEAVQHALAALASGGMIVVVDDEDRDNEGDLVVAAKLVTDRHMALPTSTCPRFCGRPRWRASSTIQT